VDLSPTLTRSSCVVEARDADDDVWEARQSASRDPLLDLREAPDEVEGIRRDASWFVLSAAVFLGEPTAYSPPVPFVSIRKVRVIPSRVSPAWRVRMWVRSEQHAVLRR
jgi:hypothetical protein